MSRANLAHVPIEMHIRRPDLVVRDPLDQLRRFFGADLSSAGRESYDAYVQSGRSPRHRILLEDIVTINSTMGARSPYRDWNRLIARGEMSELRRVKPGWDLFLMSEKSWRNERVPDKLDSLLVAVTGRGIGISRATKVLHIKRPRLIPICDSYVLKRMDIPGKGVPRAMALIQHLRKLRHDLLPEVSRFQRVLGTQGYDRTLVRIADGLIWVSQPDDLRGNNTHPPERS